MGTWARTLLGPDYGDENEYTHTSYNTMHVKHASSNLEREASPKPMKRSVLPWKPARPRLPGQVGHRPSRKGSSGAERGYNMADVEGKERFALGCARSVVGERRGLCGTVITRLITCVVTRGN